MKFLLLRVLLSLAIIGWFTWWVHAGSDDVSWSDYSLYTEYDDGDEELEIKFVVYSHKNPNEDFELEMEVGDEDCEMELEYSSFQVKGECILDIDEDDVQGLYDTSLVVTSLDSDEEVYDDNSVEFEVEGYEEEFDWDDLIVDASYEEDDEKIEMRIYLEDVSDEPDYDYEIEFEIDDKTFTKEFDWDDDEEEFYVEVSTSIDEDDIEDEYDIDFEVFNTDLDDDKVWSGDLEFDVEIISEDDDFDWDDIEYTAIYDEDRERLYLNFYLEDISSEPNRSYESFIEFEDEDYDEGFTYDEDTEQLIAEYTIKIDEDDLGYYYDIDLVIEDEDEDEVFDDEVDVDIEFLSEADDFDWDDLKVTASYDEDDERIYIELVLEDITSTPTFTYTTDIEFGDEEEYAVFSYDSDEDELRASINTRIDEDDIEDEYEIEVEVNNSDEEDEVYDEDVDVEVDDYADIASEESSEYEWKDTTLTLNYSTDSQYLIMQIELENIDEYPSLDYYTDIRISDYDDDLEWKMRYDSQNQKLYATYNLYIKEDEIEDDYTITMFINNEFDSLQHLYSENIDVIFDAHVEEEEEPRVSTATKKAVDNFMEKIYNRYDSEQDALDYFAIVITTLDAYAAQKTRYKSVIDDINYLLQEEIDANS